MPNDQARNVQAMSQSANGQIVCRPSGLPNPPLNERLGFGSFVISWSLGLGHWSFAREVFSHYSHCRESPDGEFGEYLHSTNALAAFVKLRSHPRCDLRSRAR